MIMENKFRSRPPVRFRPKFGLLPRVSSKNPDEDRTRSGSGLVQSRRTNMMPRTGKFVRRRSLARDIVDRWSAASFARSDTSSLAPRGRRSLKFRGDSSGSGGDSIYRRRRRRRGGGVNSIYSRIRQRKLTSGSGARTRMQTMDARGDMDDTAGASGDTTESENDLETDEKESDAEKRPSEVSQRSRKRDEPRSRKSEDAKGSASVEEKKRDDPHRMDGESEERLESMIEYGCPLVEVMSPRVRDSNRVTANKSIARAVQTEDDFDSHSTFRDEGDARRPNVILKLQPTGVAKKQRRKKRAQRPFTPGGAALPDMTPEISVRSLRVCAVSSGRVRVKVKLKRSQSQQRTRCKKTKKKLANIYHVNFAAERYFTPRERRVTRYLLSSNESLSVLNYLKKKRRIKKEDRYLRKFDKAWAAELLKVRRLSKFSKMNG